MMIGDGEENIDFDVASLNDDVLTEILLRLPVKTLIRFQSVCKSWLFLISSDHFRRLHTLLRRHKPPPSFILATTEKELFYCNPITKQRMTPLDSNAAFNNFVILSCSNGLMVLRCNFYVDYYVYNPTTKQSKKLSLLHSENMLLHVVSLNLVFDPSKSLHYKIVCFRSNDRRRQIEVFNSETGMWKVVCMEEEEYRLPCGVICTVVCAQLKSSIYFIYRYPTLYDFISYTQLIVCPIPKAAVYSHILQESNGSLYYCTLHLPNSAALWELQVNEDEPHRSKWLLKYDHRVPRLHVKDSKPLRFITETTTVLIHVPTKIVAYNFLDKTYKQLLHLDPCVEVHQFGETLAPL